MRDNRAALGLTAADVDALTLATEPHPRHRHHAPALPAVYGGIPAFDNGLRVNLDRGGRILNVTGAPLSGLRVDSTVPPLDAVAAMRALQRNVGVERAIDVTSGPAGERRVTHFARGDFARLVLFGSGHGARLAWHLTYQATSLAYYDAVVDATTARSCTARTLTKFDAPADVFPSHPAHGRRRSRSTSRMGNGSLLRRDRARRPVRARVLGQHTQPNEMEITIVFDRVGIRSREVCSGRFRFRALGQYLDGVMLLFRRDLTGARRDHRALPPSGELSSARPTGAQHQAAVLRVR